jgi:hypothetical protein
MLGWCTLAIPATQEADRKLLSSRPAQAKLIGKVRETLYQNKIKKRVRTVAKVVEHLPTMHKTQCSRPCVQFPILKKRSENIFDIFNHHGNAIMESWKSH